MTFVEADLAGNSTPDVYIQISGLQTLTAANFALTAAQSSADLANGAALSVSTIRSASSPTEYSYTNVIGRPYSSFQSIYATCMTLSANDLNFSSTANELDLLSNGLDDQPRLRRGKRSRSGRAPFRWPINQRNDRCERLRRRRLRLRRKFRQ